MRVVFLGSADFACASLETLLTSDGVEVVGVLTQPDRPRGRNLALAACPVKARVASRLIPVLTPLNVNAPESLDALRALKPDLLVVVAYGQILRRELLGLPPLGCINLHASLLPKYRGAAPVVRAVAGGEIITGVTTMRMNERMDAGDILMQRAEPIGAGDTGGSLHDRLAAAGAVLLAETLRALAGGTLRGRTQDEAMVTMAPKLNKADGRLDWRRTAVELERCVRAFNPWPVCFCPLPDGDTLRVWQASVESCAAGAAPGQVLDAGGLDGPLVAADSGALRLRSVQLVGRRVMGGAEFLRGHPLSVGTVLL
ncbi:MAG: methionyl-tRNA formyltransferase [bacterium]